jgi:hypothetical protein
MCILFYWLQWQANANYSYLKMSTHIMCSHCFFFSDQYPAQGPTNSRGSIPLSIFSVWTSPHKLAPEKIEPETLRGAHSKVANQHHLPK